MDLKLTDKNIRLRKVNDNDHAVLLEIYASTRAEEMKQIPQWTELMKKEFLKQQFTAQHIHYQNNYPGADFWILERNKKPIGRLYVCEYYENKTLRIIDITLLPAYRDKTYGSGILKDLIKKAEEYGLPLSIHVESFNPARRLYERLGFRKISETNGVYHLMEWKHTI